MRKPLNVPTQPIIVTMQLIFKGFCGKRQGTCAVFNEANRVCCLPMGEGVIKLCTIF